MYVKFLKYQTIIHRSLLMGLLLLCTVSYTHSVVAMPRTALVIGNGQYSKISPLKNATNDARSMAKALRTVGFDVIEVHDQNRDGMLQAVRQFKKKLSRGGAGMFYYAGHGVNLKGKNFLIPVNSNILDQDDVVYNAVDVGLVLDAMDEAGNSLNIVVLDACRNNPFPSKTRAATRGLVRLDAPTGMLIAYATAEGEVAEDGDGINGTYTKYLLEEMMVPNLPVEMVFKNVRKAVKKATNNQQVPMEESSLDGHFSFVSISNETEGRITEILNGLEKTRRVKPVTATRIRKMQNYYAELETLSPRHEALAEKDEVLAGMHKAVILESLNKPLTAVTNIDEINKHFYAIELLTPQSSFLDERDRYIGAAYHSAIRKLRQKGELKKALKLAKAGQIEVVDPKLLAVQESIEAQLLRQNAPKPVTIPTTVQPGPTTNEIMKLGLVNFEDPEMNCVSSDKRFTKHFGDITGSRSNKAVAKEFVSDACSNVDWLYLGFSRDYRNAKKSCSSLSGDWSLITKEEFSKLITDEKYPGHGGMMDQTFFPEGEVIGPQQVYWTSTKERGRYVLISGVSGVSTPTIDKNTIAYVMCTRAAK